MLLHEPATTWGPGVVLSWSHNDRLLLRIVQSPIPAAQRLMGAVNRCSFIWHPGRAEIDCCLASSPVPCGIRESHRFDSHPLWVPRAPVESADLAQDHLHNRAAGRPSGKRAGRGGGRAAGKRANGPDGGQRPLKTSLPNYTASFLLVGALQSIRPQDGCCPVQPQTVNICNLRPLKITNLQRCVF